MNDGQNSDALALVRDAFDKRGVPLVSATVRQFPGEIIVVVEVSEKDFVEAVNISNDLDSRLLGGFVTVKKVQTSSAHGQKSHARVRTH